MSKDCDDSSQAEVDGGGEEGRTDSESDEIDDKVVVVEIILPEHDPADIADDFQAGTANYGNDVSPCAILDCETNVYQ